MIPISLAFLLGDLCLQTFEKLPSYTNLAILVLITIITQISAKRWRILMVAAAALTGFIYTGWYANQLLSWSLPKNLEGRPTIIVGTVASLPMVTKWQTKFKFSMEKFNSQTLNHTVLLQLGWHQPTQKLSVGDKIQLQVRLTRIQGTQNPAGFDYEAVALHSGVRATGMVLPNQSNKILSHSWLDYSLNQIRERISHKIHVNSPKSETAHWLMALVVGEKVGIPAKDWDVLRRTGTNHLMAIAGLHIGVIFGLIHFISGYFWKRSQRLVLQVPVHIASAFVALIAAFIYSALSGFALPAQRASIMLTAFIAALLLRRKISAWESWSLAMLVVLLINPLSVLSDSFWLSFGTIALIIYGMSARLSPQGYWWKWCRVQWVIGLGLTPLSVHFFQESSIVSIVVNSIAIPWISFLVLPFCFASGIVLMISERVGALLLLVADKSLALLWQMLAWFSALPLSVVHFSMPNKTILFVSIVGFILFLLPSGMPGRILGFIWLMPLFLYQPPAPGRGEYWLTLLDVGQGLAVIVQTQTHLLVYDTGVKLGTGFDMGEHVILPYLRTLNAKKIDTMVISHGDNDHLGGAAAILRALPVNYLYSSVPARISTRAMYCMAGMSWAWDGVTFSFLHPTQAYLGMDNDASCVLRITNSKHAGLLTGDIEKPAEEALLASMSALLASDILIAPHHGSKTSGLKAFVHAVHPQYVLYATGYRNRYHFPHKSVQREYSLINSTQLDTAVTGAILFKIDEQDQVSAPYEHRIAKRHYWYNS